MSAVELKISFLKRVLISTNKIKISENRYGNYDLAIPNTKLWHGITFFDGKINREPTFQEKKEIEEELLNDNYITQHCFNNKIINIITIDGIEYVNDMDNDIVAMRINEVSDINIKKLI